MKNSFRCLVLCILIVPLITFAGNDMNTPSTPSLSMGKISDLDPSYKIIIAPEKFVINKNEQLKITIYFTGDGEVTDAKLAVYTDERSKLIDPNNDNEINYGHAKKLYTNVKKLFAPLGTTDKSKASILISETGSVTKIEGKNLQIKPYNPYLFETSYAGDHFIKAILTYSNGKDEWRTADETIIIHVNSHLERYQTPYKIFGIFVALLAIIAGGIFNVEIRKWLGLP